MRPYAHREAFEFIELRGGVTVEEFALKFGILKSSAATWLSKKTSQGYLKWEQCENTGTPGRPKGRYVIGEKWWGEEFFDDTA